MGNNAQLSDTTAFILKQPATISSAEVMKRAKEAKIKLVTAQRIAAVRSWGRKTGRIDPEARIRSGPRASTDTSAATIPDSTSSTTKSRRQSERRTNGVHSSNGLKHPVLIPRDKAEEQFCRSLIVIGLERGRAMIADVERSIREMN